MTAIRLGFYFLSRSLALRHAIAVTVFFALIFSGCTNNTLISLSKDPTSTSSSAAPNSIVSTDGNSAGINVVRVQLNTQNPTSMLDLIGDGSGTLGSSCGVGQDGKNTCNCAFSYTDLSGSQRGPLEMSVTYSEYNMVRCNYSLVPTSAKLFNVYINIPSSQTRSNSLNFRLSGSVGLSSPTDSTSFSKVLRYQCKTLTFIPYLWSQGIYDPILSEDPRYSFPMNFYTINMGKTLSRYAGGDSSIAALATGVTQWNCPAIPNDTSAGMDLTLYSSTADSTGSKRIFPATGSFDRSTFYVAKNPVGQFTVPVNAYTLPDVLTSTAAGNHPPLGYAARPVPTSNGGESCPDTSQEIPKGYHWAKIWQFRTAFQPRVYPVARKLAALGNVACNGKPWEVKPLLAAPGDTYCNDCSGAPHIGNLDATTGMAARWFTATVACAKVNPGGTTLSSLIQDTNYSSYALGTDLYESTYKDLINGGCASSNKPQNGADAGLCDSSGSNTVVVDLSPAMQTFGTAGADTRADYVFVVSPPSVNRSEMQSSNSNNTFTTYLPYRFRSPNDCLNPDNPVQGDCSSSKMIKYGIVTYDVSTSSSPGANDANRAGDFPLCVVQPD